MLSRVLNCGLKIKTDAWTIASRRGVAEAHGIETEIGILSYLAFVQDTQLKMELNEMVKVGKSHHSQWNTIEKANT